MFSQEVATKSELDDKAVRVQEAEDGEVHSPLKDNESDDDSVRWGDYNYQWAETELVLYQKKKTKKWERKFFIFLF